MRRIAWITATATLATVIALMLADGVVEIIAFEVIVGALAFTAFIAIGPLRPAQILERPSLVRAPSANHPPQLQRLEWMVEFATTASADAELRLVPELRHLAAARLQERHQIDLHANGTAAADLLGIEAWAHLDPRRPRRFGRSALTTDELDAIVAAIEDL